MKPHIIKGDTVVILRGKERTKRGTVKAVHAAAGMAIVEGANVVKRHTKQQQSKSSNMGSSQTGGIVEKEAPLPLSVLQYVCEKCKAPTRLRRGRTSDGALHRICVRCGEPARESAKGA
jgi:large subunit ribosomal protein L24